MERKWGGEDKKKGRVTIKYLSACHYKSHFTSAGLLESPSPHHYPQDRFGPLQYIIIICK